MTHILLNIKYKNRESILIDDTIGKKLIVDWTNYNLHTLVKEPIMYVFPAAYIMKKNDNEELYYHNVDMNENDVVRKLDYCGYTGLGLLSESHISIHTYPEKNTIHIDFFSCKQLDEDKNKDFIEKRLKQKESIIFQLTFINRELE